MHSLHHIIRPAICCLLLIVPAIKSLHAQDYDVFKAPFNSEEADFSGSFGKDIIVFSSTRAKTNVSFLEDTVQTYFTDLYVVKITGKNALGQDEYSKPEPLRGNVNTLHNEGQSTFSSDGSLMIYTGNMKQGSENKIEKVEEFKLGLFTAQQFKDSWLKTAEFPYNSRNGKYSVAHPCLSANDSILYFASNMPGGRGGSDIYRSYWRNNMWSEPENLGPEINSRGNEFFPFVNEFGILFFSTDARDDSEGMDIYYSIEESGKFIEPQKLNNTINSEYDEFAYSEKRGVSMGTFSSNRDGGVDDIYLFAKYNSDYKNCHDNNKPALCYRIKDDKLSKLEGLPFKYQWNMGDGNLLYGNQIEYCYEKYGKYKISLNIIDTLTKQVFARVSELDLDILTEEKPFISSHDTVFTNIPFHCQLDLGKFTQFEVEKIEWMVSDGESFKGKSFSHIFEKPGNYQIKVGLIGKKKGKAPQPKMCIFKDVVCVIPPTDQPLPEELECCNTSKVSELKMKYDHLVLDDSGKRLSPYYRLVVAESDTPLEFTDSLFSVIADEISELKTETGYEYTIARATDWSELLPLYQELKQEGLQEMKAEIIGEIEYEHRLVRTGTYLATKGAVNLNTTVAQSLAQGKTHRIVIHQSSEKLSFDNPLFSKIDGEITELKTENGYMYVVEAPVEFTDMTMVAEHFQALGIANPELLEITESAWEERQSDFGKYTLQTKDSELAGKPESIKQSKILLFTSAVQVPFTDVIFEHISTEITEIKTENGFAYYVDPGANEYNVEELINSLRSEKIPSPEFVEFEPLAWEQAISQKGHYLPAQIITDNKIGKILLTFSREPVPDNAPELSRVVPEITEIKVEDGFAYVIAAPIEFKEIQPLIDSYKAEGFENASYLEMTEEEWLAAQTGRNMQTNIDALAERKINYIKLFQSPQRLEYSDKKFAGIKGKITEIKSETGYTYVAEIAHEITELQPLISAYKFNGYPDVEIVTLEEIAFTNAVVSSGNFTQKPTQGSVSNTPETISIIYTVVVVDASDRLPLNSNVFRKINENISELQSADGTKYIYALRNLDSKVAAEKYFADLQRSGIEPIRIDSMKLEDFNSRLLRTGKYIAPKNAQALNIEFSKLADIKFEYNSAEIKPESYANLNYIASMLLLENDFSVRLGAHTCTMGGAEYNEELSQRRAQSVVDYFISKGVGKERLFPKGYGQTKPMASNETEDGRKQNRRVEFVILFNTRVTP